MIDLLHRTYQRSMLGLVGCRSEGIRALRNTCLKRIQYRFHRRDKLSTTVLVN
jgi:hypothetical protein